MSTFNKVTDECSQVVGLLFLALAHLHHIRQILTDILQHFATHLHLTLKESEQWVLMVTCSTTRHFYKRQNLYRRLKFSEITSHYLVRQETFLTNYRTAHTSFNHGPPKTSFQPPLKSDITLMFSTVRLSGLTVCGMSCSQLQAVECRVLIQAG